MARPSKHSFFFPAPLWSLIFSQMTLISTQKFHCGRANKSQLELLLEVNLFYLTTWLQCLLHVVCYVCFSFFLLTYFNWYVIPSSIFPSNHRWIVTQTNRNKQQHKSGHCPKRWNSLQLQLFISKMLRKNSFFFLEKLKIFVKSPVCKLWF